MLLRAADKGMKYDDDDVMGGTFVCATATHRGRIEGKSWVGDGYRIVSRAWIVVLIYVQE